MPLLAPLGCKNQRLLLQSIAATETLAPQPTPVGISDGKVKQNILQQRATNYFFRAPPFQSKSLPQVIESLQHWSQIKAIAWSPPPSHSHFWPICSLADFSPKPWRQELVTKSRHLGWGKTQTELIRNPICLCSPRAWICVLWTCVTLNNFEKLLQHYSSTKISDFKWWLCCRCPSKTFLRFAQRLAYGKIWNSFQTASIWSELTARATWNLTLLTGACTRMGTNAKYSESRRSRLKCFFDQKDSASIIPEFVKSLFCEV